MVCVTSKGSDQPAHTRRLIRAFWSLNNSMSVKLLNIYRLEYLSLKGGCTGSSESTLVRMPHCWKSHVIFIEIYLLFMRPNVDIENEIHSNQLISHQLARLILLVAMKAYINLLYDLGLQIVHCLQVIQHLSYYL